MWKANSKETKNSFKNSSKKSPKSRLRSGKRLALFLRQNVYTDDSTVNCQKERNNDLKIRR